MWRIKRKFEAHNVFVVVLLVFVVVSVVFVYLLFNFIACLLAVRRLISVVPFAQEHLIRAHKCCRLCKRFVVVVVVVVIARPRPKARPHSLRKR